MKSVPAAVADGLKTQLENVKSVPAAKRRDVIATVVRPWLVET